MRLCRTNNASFLPEVYGDLACSPKKQRQSVLQSAVTEAGQALQVYHPILVPPGIVDKVMTMEWASANPDDLSQGINPFLIGQPTPTEEVQMRNTLQLQSLVYSGSAAPSLADARTLTAPPAVRLPSTLPEAVYTMATYQVYLHVLLGANHIATTYVREMRGNLNRNLHILQFDATPHLPALFLRHIQRATTLWAGRQRDTTVPLAWPGKDVVMEACMGNYAWAARLPPSYLTTPRGTHSTPNPAPAPSPAPPSGGRQQPTPDRQEQVMETRANGADPCFAPILARNVPVRAIKAKSSREQSLRRSTPTERPAASRGHPRACATPDAGTPMIIATTTRVRTKRVYWRGAPSTGSEDPVETWFRGAASGCGPVMQPSWLSHSPADPAKNSCSPSHCHYPWDGKTRHRSSVRRLKPLLT